MSSYDPNSMAVEVNLEHDNYDALEKLKKKSSEKAEVYSTKEKNYIRRRYLWELIKNFYKGEELEDKFWDLFERFFRHKDTS